MVTLWNTQGIPVTCHDSLELLLPPGMAQEASSFLGSRVLSLAFLGVLYLCAFNEAYFLPLPPRKPGMCTYFARILGELNDLHLENTCFQS